MPFSGDPLLDTDSFLAETSVRKTADETVNNTATMQGDDVLSLPFQPGRHYDVHLQLKVNSPAAADLKFRFVETSAGGVTGDFNAYATPAGGAALTQTPGGTGTVFTVEGGAPDRLIDVFGRLDVGANGGNLKVEWAQNTATVANTIVKAGSFLRLQEIA